jgi:2-C-methyl-D-erythritol 4-phosphate cytidylyltransferase/2-C-methyl-D-erythritol 2,4-cyclodiphosphate synthase
MTESFDASSSAAVPTGGAGSESATPVTVGVIVVAAGSGSRLGQAVPKAFVPVAGRTVLARCLTGVLALGEAVQVVVVAPEQWRAEALAIVAKSAGVAAASVSVVVGGATRQLSVAAGIAALGDQIDVVLVHDSARALTPTLLLESVIDAVYRTP